MKTTLLLDTGPLVAALNRGDRFHGWAVAELERAAPPVFTCESVLSEACFLLRRERSGAAAVLQLVERDVVRLPLRSQSTRRARGS